jgi:hypothetical protein
MSLTRDNQNIIAETIKKGKSKEDKRQKRPGLWK